MPASRHNEALLCLPDGHARGALRAGLMAMNVVPQPLLPDARTLHAQLRALEHDAHRVAFVDISDHRPSLIDLDHALPPGPWRARVLLTRLQRGHVSGADRRWVHKLGFGGLWAELGVDPLSARLERGDHAAGHHAAHDEEEDKPGLRHALDRVAAALGTDAPSSSVLKRHAASTQGSNDHPARERIRRIAGTSAEAAAATLAKRLRIRERQYHLRNYPACFVGRSAVRAIATTFDCSDDNALEVGQALHALGLLVHVTHDHGFEDRDYFYRLAVSRRADGVGLPDALSVLLAGVAVDDRSWHARTYPRSWIGSEAVDLVMGRFGLERHHAWIVLHRLMQAGAFGHVAGERPFIDGYFFYRFAPVLDEALLSNERRADAPLPAPGSLLPTW
jgi:hypothetical protein